MSSGTTADTASAVQLLDGLYEHSPWIAEAALQQRQRVIRGTVVHGDQFPAIGLLTDHGVETGLQMRGRIEDRHEDAQPGRGVLHGAVRFSAG